MMTAGHIPNFASVLHLPVRTNVTIFCKPNMSFLEEYRFKVSREEKSYNAK